MTDAERDLLKAIAKEVLTRCPKCHGEGRFTTYEYSGTTERAVVTSCCTALREAIDRVG